MSEALVEELAEDVALLGLCRRENLLVQILQVEVDDDVVQVDVSCKTCVVVRGDRDATSARRIDQKFTRLDVDPEREINLRAEVENHSLSYIDDSVELVGAGVVGAPVLVNGIPVERTSISLASRLVISSRVMRL